MRRKNGNASAKINFPCYPEIKMIYYQLSAIKDSARSFCAGYADMAELADALDLGSSEQPSCRFNSCYPHLIFKAESILVYECFSAFFFYFYPLSTW